MIEDYFDNFFNGRGYSQRSDQVSISKNEYKKLMTIKDKYESLAAEHKRIKSQNDALLKELDDMRKDGRKFKELEEEKEKYLNSLLRARADLENYQKRSERENKRYRDYEMQKILLKLVNHYDDLQRALNVVNYMENGESIEKGFEFLVKNFEKILIKKEIKPMNCEGEIFDPYEHEAMMVEEGHDNLPENTILEELEKGYYYKDKVLRPARVKISKKSNLKNQNKDKIQIKGSE
jgi:molecular chaperone GrpE